MQQNHYCQEKNLEIWVKPIIPQKYLQKKKKFNIIFFLAKIEIEWNPIFTNQIEFMRNKFDIYLDNRIELERILLAIFCVFIFLTFVLVWVPFIVNRGNLLRLSRSMLKMLNHDSLKHNESLKIGFASKEFLDACK